MRGKKNLMHRKSRKGLACLEDEMIQKSDSTQGVSRSDVWIEGYTTKKKRMNNDGDDVEAKEPEIVKQVKKYKTEGTSFSIKDDVVAKILGPDPRGRVRGLGFGATPSKRDGHRHIHVAFHVLENEVADLRVMEKESSSYQGSATDRAQSKAKKSRSLSQSANPRTQSNGNGASAQSPKEGRNCKLMNWAGTNHEVVALGEIISTDPTTLTHFVPIGKNCWKVAVHDVLDDDVPMYRPTR